MMSQQESQEYPLESSLYVGDLSEDCTEAVLFEKFSTVGPILSICLCRDKTTSRSLGYAYVNFHQREDAERARSTMNCDIINGRPIRIMWSQRDPSLRKSGVNNVFIKNLDKEINSKILYNSFSSFGNILSCKVAIDDEGHSKGYGFVHFETEEAAKNAIRKVNRMKFNGRDIHVSPFIPRYKRISCQTDVGYTNVFIKNFGENLDSQKLYEIFAKYGKITSHRVMVTDDGKSKGFGFVAFQQPESAQTAIRELNNLDFDGKLLYVSRAQKKEHRRNELKKEFEKVNRKNRKSVNLYIKNIEDAITEEKLYQLFSVYGTVTSVKIVYENGRSKGFGFVCFSAAEEAKNAKSNMNGLIIANKPLYVDFLQRKDDRKVQLALYFQSRFSLTNRKCSGIYEPKELYHLPQGTYHQGYNLYYFPQWQPQP